MAITAAMVKELRELTGAGVMACKNALVETDGNQEAAIEVLRKKGEATRKLLQLPKVIWTKQWSS